MAHEIIDSDDGFICVRFSGLMRFADQLALQAAAREWLDQGKPVRVLACAENFGGWEKTDDWSDIGFMLEHGDGIVRMAIVGDERWREDIFLFLGKGLRRTEIEFFTTDRRAEAERWVRA